MKSYEEERLLKIDKQKTNSQDLQKSKNDKTFSTNNANQAEITKQMLEENNIKVVLLNKQDSSYLMFDQLIYMSLKNN